MQNHWLAGIIILIAFPAAVAQGRPGYGNQTPTTAPRLNPDRPPAERAADLASRTTPEKKALQATHHIGVGGGHRCLGSQVLAKRLKRGLCLADRWARGVSTSADDAGELAR
jgi:hypothetical protein